MQYLSLLVFLNKDFKFQANVCNMFHDLLMMPTNLSDIAILNFRGADYYCVIRGISKSEAINLMRHIDLTKETGLQNKL